MEVRLTTVGTTRFLTNPHDNYVGKSLEVYGEWSYGEIHLFSSLLRRDQNIVEVGANIGAHTVFLARDVCPAGIAYAFEPRRIIFQMLCANVALNGLTNVFAFQKAVGSKPGSMTEGPVPTAAGANLGGIPLGKLQGGGEHLDIAPLDDMLEAIKPISLLKVDVEGWEREVLIGAQALIARDRPILYVENDRVENSRELITHIMDSKYDLWWHIVRLFRPDNFAHTAVNIFGNVASFNMLCVPSEKRANISGLKKIEDADLHPLRKKKIGEPVDKLALVER